MTVLSDKWIKKTAKQKGMIKPFVANRLEKEKFLSDYPLMDMMQEFQMNLKFLLMSIQV